MKLKNLTSAALASLLLVLFLPVFYHVIMYGNNMNYNPEHKIYALFGNKVLLAIAFVCVLVFLALLYFVRKIPTNKYTVRGFVGVALLVSIAFYFMNVEISKCIAFYGGWDCGMVANSARWMYEGKGIGYDDYYYIFTNNVPITWLLYKLYSFSSSLAGYPYNPEFIWIQFQCLMHALAVFFSAMTVLVVSRKVPAAGMTLIVNFVFLGLTPWKIIPYTDATPIVFPIVVLFLYAIFVQVESKWKYLLWLLATFFGMLGGIFKATCYVTLIAVVIMEVIRLLTSQEKVGLKIRTLAVRCAVLVAGIGLAICCRNGMYKTLDYEYDPRMDIGWAGFLYDGLNEESTGACSEDAYRMAQEYADAPKEVKDELMYESVKNRLSEKGFMGLMDFWLRKQVMTYNDGTFSWHQEGFFHAWDYDDITDSSWKEPLRAFYWQEGEYYKGFVTLSHGIWLMILVGILVAAVMLLVQAVRSLRQKTDSSVEMHMSAVTVLIFIGVFLFVMLFEGRARYLYTSIPIFSTMAVMGGWQLVEALNEFADTRKRKSM